MENIKQLSEQLLLAMKKQESSLALSNQLANFPMKVLKDQLSTDTHKKAFWINCYNAYYLILRKELNISKEKIYKEEAIQIAGEKFSLDDIEHGILRKYRHKLSLGYLPNVFAKALIKELAVEKLDYRIHFALNCGAKSCPPIAFYSSERLEAQLEMATLSFLESETQFDTDKNEIRLSKIFQWFRADFGGKDGIREIHYVRLKIPIEGQKIIYNDYDWSDDLDNFSEETF